MRQISAPVLDRATMVDHRHVVTQCIAYIESINKTGWAVEHGYQVDKNEKIIRTVINELMCNLFVDFNEIGKMYDSTAKEVKQIVDYDPEKLSVFIADNLLEIDGEQIKVHDDGSLIVRNIAMAFDPQLTITKNQYSKTI